MAGCGLYFVCTSYLLTDWAACAVLEDRVRLRWAEVIGRGVWRRDWDRVSCVWWGDECAGSRWSSGWRRNPPRMSRFHREDRGFKPRTGSRAVLFAREPRGWSPAEPEMGVGWMPYLYGRRGVGISRSGSGTVQHGRSLGSSAGRAFDCSLTPLSS